MCKCDCGTERTVIGSDLRKGKSTNCGCVAMEAFRSSTKMHGETNTRLHRIWKNMKARCLRQSHPQFQQYGGRGISICDEWLRYLAFRDWALDNGYSDDLSIERVDVNGDYCPGNCEWATAQTQAENRRFVAKNDAGELWWHIAQRNGITQGAYRTRLFDGWSHQEAATHPLGKRRFERKRGQDGKFI